MTVCLCLHTEYRQLLACTASGCRSCSLDQACTWDRDPVGGEVGAPWVQHVVSQIFQWCLLRGSVLHAHAQLQQVRPGPRALCWQCTAGQEVTAQRVMQACGMEQGAKQAWLSSISRYCSRPTCATKPRKASSARRPFLISSAGQGVVSACRRHGRSCRQAGGATAQAGTH